MVWIPVQPDHAIERVRILIHFGEDLPPKFLRKLAADNENHRIELGFTSKNLREGQQISVGANGLSVNSQPTEIFGWDWQKVSSANSPLEVLVVENQSLIYETFEYSRWDNFAHRFATASQPIIEPILKLVDLKTITLEYFDLFFFDGEPLDANPGEVLKNFHELLPQTVANGSELWHFHRGWFEYLDNEKVLAVQNINAQDGTRSDGKSVRAISINTRTELRMGEAPLINNNNDLTKFLGKLHIKSKALFESILTDDMRNKVGLGGKSNV